MLVLLMAMSLLQIFMISSSDSCWDSLISWGSFYNKTKESKLLLSLSIDVGCFEGYADLDYVGEFGLFNVSSILSILWLIYLNTLLRVPSLPEHISVYIIYLLYSIISNK